MKSVPWLHKLVENKWYVDELYEGGPVRLFRALSDFSAQYFDRGFIDGVVNLVGKIPMGLGTLVRLVQNGRVHTYGAVLAMGMLAVLAATVYRPGAELTYTVEARGDTAELNLKVQGGPGYSYYWDLDGDGEYQTDPAEGAQHHTCTPKEEGNKRVCVVGVRVENVFGGRRTIRQTIEVPSMGPRSISMQGGDRQ